MFVKIEVRCVAGMFPEIGQALVDRQTADLVGNSRINMQLLLNGVDQAFNQSVYIHRIYTE